MRVERRVRAEAGPDISSAGRMIQAGVSVRVTEKNERLSVTHLKPNGHFISDYVISWQGGQAFVLLSPPPAGNAQVFMFLRLRTCL